MLVKRQESLSHMLQEFYETSPSGCVRCLFLGRGPRALARGLPSSPSTPLYDAFEGALKNARAGGNRRSSETERRCKTSRSIAVRIEREVALRHIAAGASQEANTMTMQPLGRSSRETIAPPRCCLRAYFTADLWKKGHRTDVRSMLRREVRNTPRGLTRVQGARPVPRAGSELRGPPCRTACGCGRAVRAYSVGVDLCASSALRRRNPHERCDSSTGRARRRRHVWCAHGQRVCGLGARFPLHRLRRAGLGGAAVCCVRQRPMC